MRRLAQEEFTLAYVHEIRKKDPGLGGWKLWNMYKRDFTGNKPMGRDRFEALIDRYNLKVRKRMRKPRTTDSRHGLPLYRNLIKDFIPTGPNQLWVSDITYIPVWLDGGNYSFCYLSLILDAYTEEIIGWSVGPTLDTEYPIQALQMALERIKDVSREDVRLTHHSDRGIQYASKRYVELLKDAAVQKRRTNKFIECFRKLPEEFTTEVFAQVFGYANTRSAQTTLNRLLADKAIERTMRGNYKKLVSELPLI